MYDQQSSKLMAILTFIPQWSVIITAGFALKYDIFFAMVI